LESIEPERIKIPLPASLLPFCLLGSFLAANDASPSVDLLDAGPAALERKPDSDSSRYIDYLSGLQKKVQVSPDETRPVVLCIGSSSFRLWDAEEALPKFKVINFGFGGSRFSDVNNLWSYLIPPAEPDYVLIYEGDNDVVSKSAFQVFEDFLEVMGRVQAEFPDSQVVIVPVKPSPRRVQYWEEAEKVNAAMALYAKSRENVTVVEGANAKLLDDEGVPYSHLYSDGIHFNDEGYDLWNAAIRACLLK